MIDYSYGDYYSGLLTGGKQGVKKKINKHLVILLIKQGMSSVKIAKKCDVSYPTIMSYVKKEIPIPLENVAI